MKKILLFLVGVISIGLCCSYSIVGNGQEKSKSIDFIVEENDGVLIDSEDTKPVKKKSIYCK